ncbi:MAG: hypothetical protein ACOCQR_02150 [bacterium]
MRLLLSNRSWRKKLGTNPYNMCEPNVDCDVAYDFYLDANSNLHKLFSG